MLIRSPLLFMVSAGCIQPLEGPLAHSVLECHGDGDRFLSVVGLHGSETMALYDSDPPAGVMEAAGTQYVLDGSAEGATYTFVLHGYDALAKGSHRLEGDEFELQLEVSRASLGRFELSSVSGSLTLEEFADDRLQGIFDAEMGAPGNTFQGCFDLASEPVP